ncbi:MAG: hypothetical protein HY899_14320 [Deltaproteobacteria bacterium]|nr:hypothetical protein [Deltaproteobacteria bacterium]
MRRKREPSPSIAPVLEGKRLVVLVGEGGVGKTSTAAALAYGHACTGSSVAVLTVDPAPRLGDALGIRDIEATPRAVALPGGPAAKGSLVAMRLDSKRTFDRMVERYAPSREVAGALLRHPIYQAVSGSLGGSEHYMAFQRLSELVESADQDLLVIDTPPAANASELLGAPARLTGLFDTGALSILAEPARLLARATGTLTRASLAFVIAVVERVAGDSLRTGVGDFIGLFGDILAGLEDRTTAINELLRSGQTAFVMVVRPRSNDIARAIAFEKALAAIGLHIDAIVVNRLTPPPGLDRVRSRAERLVEAPAQARGAVVVMEREMDSLRQIESKALASLRDAMTGRNAPVVIAVTSLDVDVATLDDIATLAGELFAER